MAKRAGWHSLTFILAVFLAALLISCGTGGGGGSDDGDDTSPDTTAAAKVDLFVSSPQLPSSGATTLTLTALVTDENNVALEGQEVSFSTTSGVLVVTNGTTDASGIATATLGIGSDKSNRTITVLAQADAVKDASIIQVTGTAVSISGQNTLVWNGTTQLTILLKDSSGNSISGAKIAVTSVLGNAISGSQTTTDTNGLATVNVTATHGGTDTITATATELNASATYVLYVSTESFTFTSPSSGQECNIGASYPVSVHYAVGGVNQVGKTVDFTTTRGTVTPTSAVTDADGNAAVSVSSTTAGPSVITASVQGTDTSVQVPLEFVATTPNRMTLEASPGVINTNSGSSTLEQSMVTARIRDAAGNLVKNKRVNFVLTDRSGGSINPSSAMTNSIGEASTIYTAGAATSGANGVVIDASIEGYPAITAQATLTVAGKALFISLGTGNTIVPSDDDTYFTKDYVAIVTDSAGKPVSGTTVSAKAIPLKYIKGQYVWNEALSSWIKDATYGPTQCLNEDMYLSGTQYYLNGSLDPLEDNNSNGHLDPQQPVAISPVSFVTDENGMITLSLLYPQEYATWVVVTIEARTSGAQGTEYIGSITLTLPGLASDYTNKSVSPPGVVSPFGRVTDCAVSKEIEDIMGW